MCILNSHYEKWTIKNNRMGVIPFWKFKIIKCLIEQTLLKSLIVPTKADGLDVGVDFLRENISKE